MRSRPIVVWVVAVVALSALTLAAPAAATAAAEWSPLGSGLSDGAAVNAMVVDANGDIYVGGSISTAGGVPVDNIARYTPSTGSWSALAAGFPLSGYVAALAIDGNGDLLVAGTFPSVDGQEVNSLVRYSPGSGTWSPVGGGVKAAGAEGTVRALLVAPSGDIYVGGDFDTAGATAVSNVARFTPGSDTWSALNGGTGGRVEALALDGGVLYAGGIFDGAGGADSGFGNVARYARNAWSSLAGGVNSEVTSIAVDTSGNVVVGGFFADTAAVSTPNSAGIARYDTNSATWSALSTGLTPNPDNMGALTVQTLLEDGAGLLYVGGSFDSAGGLPALDIAQWDGTTWAPLGAGIGPTPIALALAGGVLYAGGTFSQAGGQNIASIAAFTSSAPSPTVDPATFPTAPPQAFAVPAGTTAGQCGALAPPWVDWPGITHLHDTGWSVSYDSWPNEGRGGPVCGRQPYFTGTGWSVR